MTRATGVGTGLYLLVLGVQAGALLLLAGCASHSASSSRTALASVVPLCELSGTCGRTGGACRKEGGRCSGDGECCSGFFCRMGPAGGTGACAAPSLSVTPARLQLQPLAVGQPSTGHTFTVTNNARTPAEGVACRTTGTG